MQSREIVPSYFFLSGCLFVLGWNRLKIVTVFAEVPKVVTPACLVWKLGFLGRDHKLMKALDHLICFDNPASVPSKDTATLDGWKVWIGYLRQTGRWRQAFAQL